MAEKKSNVANMPGVKTEAKTKIDKQGRELPNLPALPKMPKKSKSKPPQKCNCGCGHMTRGGKFLPGHDARLHGWALRVERGIVQLKDIPDGERQAVEAHMKAGAKK